MSSDVTLGRIRVDCRGGGWRCFSLVTSFGQDLRLLKTRQDRRHWLAVMLTCVCESVKYWARHLLAVAHLQAIALLCHAFDAVARLTDFATRAGLLDVMRSTLGTLSAAFVVSDVSLIVANDVIDAADLLMRQSAAILSQQHMLMAIGSLLPCADAQGRLAAHGSQHRLTTDGVVAAAAVSAMAGGALPASLATLPLVGARAHANNKRDRAAFDQTATEPSPLYEDDFDFAYFAHASLVDETAWSQMEEQLEQ